MPKGPTVAANSKASTLAQEEKTPQNVRMTENSVRPDKNLLLIIITKRKGLFGMLCAKYVFLLQYFDFPGLYHRLRYCRHINFIPVVGVGKRGAHSLVHGNAERTPVTGTTSRTTVPVPADPRQ